MGLDLMTFVSWVFHDNHLPRGTIVLAKTDLTYLVVANEHWAVVVVKWSACLPSPTIQVRILLKP